jgi:HD-like signal output (HDOD) protein
MGAEEDIHQLVASTGELISFPQAALRVNSLINSEDASMEAVAEAISQDPALAAKLLKMANSSFYGFRGEIATVKKAIQVLGLAPVRTLVLGSASTAMAEQLPNDLVSLENFWPQAIQCSIAARYLASQQRGMDREALFMAGLLHNVGLLVLFNQRPEQSLKAQEAFLYGPEGRRREQAEESVFGFHQAHVGAALMQSWDFPAVLHEPVAYQLEPEQAPSQKKAAATLHIAGVAAMLAEIESDDFDDAPAIDPTAYTLTGLDEATVSEAIRQAHEGFSMVREMLGLQFATDEAS